MARGTRIITAHPNAPYYYDRQSGVVGATDPNAGGGGGSVVQRFVMSAWVPNLIVSSGGSTILSESTSVGSFAWVTSPGGGASIGLFDETLGVAGVRALITASGTNQAAGCRTTQRSGLLGAFMQNAAAISGPRGRYWYVRSTCFQTNKVGAGDSDALLGFRDLGGIVTVGGLVGFHSQNMGNWHASIKTDTAWPGTFTLQEDLGISSTIPRDLEFRWGRDATGQRRMIWLADGQILFQYTGDLGAGMSGNFDNAPCAVEIGRTSAHGTTTLDFWHSVNGGTTEFGWIDVEALV